MGPVLKGGRQRAVDTQSLRPVPRTEAQQKKKNKGVQRKVWWAKTKGWKNAGEPEFQEPSDDEDDEGGDEKPNEGGDDPGTTLATAAPVP